MSLEAPIIAAMITAGANVATSIFQKWSGFRTQADAEVEAFTEEHYDTYRALLTDHSVVILKKMEDGQNHDLAELRNCIYPTLTFPSYQDEIIFNKEFEYRLRFLEAIGIITQPSSEYYITSAGKAFIDRARIKRDYFRVLFG